MILLRRRFAHMQLHIASLAALSIVAGGASAAEARRTVFGELGDGTAIDAVELSNGSGIRVRIITLGAAIQALEVPDRDGAVGDVVLGYATAAEYATQSSYFGVTVGRYANRIAGGRFSLDGKSYQLDTNDGGNHLHGGTRGLDKVVWAIESVTEGPAASVVMSYRSPAGDGGYPGMLDVRATYTLDDNNALRIDYEAMSDAPTIVNITNHSYFNLAGEPSNSDVLQHRLTLQAEQYTPVGATLIPTGELRDVAGTPFDFRGGAEIGSRIRDGSDVQIRHGRGYDHNFVIAGSAGELRPAATVVDPGTGRVMEMLTTAPGVQFYSGNFLDGSTVGKSGRVYRQGDAFCLEPQVYPDSPNQPSFPSARLDPGDTYRNTIVLRFSTTQ